MMFSNIFKNTVVRLVLGGIILIIVVGGNIQSFSDFIKNQSIWLILAVILISTTYLVLTNLEKLKESTARTPELNDNFFTTKYELRVEKLDNRAELLAMHSLAKSAFNRDAMTLEKIQELHWYSKNTVYLLKDEHGEVIGYCCLFVPNKDLRDNIYKGNEYYLDPMNWEKHQFIIGDAAWLEGEIYLESIVVKGKGPRERGIRALFLIRHVLSDVFENLKSYQGTIHVYGFALNTPGRNLMKRCLQLRLIREASNDEQMDLLDSYLSLRDIGNILLNVDMQLINFAHQEKDYRVHK